jgi:dUTPase
MLQLNNSITIPLGIKVALPLTTCLFLTNKSSVSENCGITISANVIDCGYTGEIHCNFVKIAIGKKDKHIKITDTYSTIIYPGMNICQGLLLPLYNENKFKLEECSNKEYQQHKDKLASVLALRQENCFGSSERKDNKDLNWRQRLTDSYNAAVTKIKNSI